MSATYNPVDPGMLALAGASPTLYGPDGRVLDPAQWRSPIDYGPGVPLTARIPEPGFPPREYIYQPGINLVTTPRQEGGGKLSFDAIRALVNAAPIVRTCINYRKTQIRGLEWEVVPDAGQSRAEIESRRADIDAARAFLDRPNRLDDVALSEWLSQALEEILVNDACVFFKHRDRAGKLHSLVQIDGSTIKVEIDPFGHVASYSQIVYGLPASRYPVVVGEYEKNDVCYLQYNPTVGSSYGTPPVEEIRPIVDLAIRRLATQVAWYTDGNIASAYLEAPAGWTSDQIGKFQNYLDDTFSGNEAQRHKLRLIPSGSNLVTAKPFAFSREEEEACNAIICAHFGVPKHLFAEKANRATSEEQGNEAQDTGLKPLVGFLAGFLTGIVRNDLGLVGLKVRPATGNTKNESERAKATVAYVAAGILTPDEARADMGRDPLDTEDTATGLDPDRIQRAFLEAGVLTRDELRASIGLPPAPTGGDEWITIGAAGFQTSEQIAGAALEPLKPAPAPKAIPAVTSPEAPPVEEEPTVEPPAPEEAVKAELATWRKFAIRRAEKGKASAPFETQAIPADLAIEIDRGLALCKSAGDVDAVFAKAKAKRLTAAKRKAAETHVKDAMLEWFQHDYRRAVAHGEEVLAGNVDA